MLRLNTDWRDIRRIISILNDADHSDQVKTQACLEIFVDNYEDITDAQSALEMLFRFIDCGERNAGGNAPKEIDWDIDFGAIISDVNKIAPVVDIRACEYMHWFTFISYFHAIEEGNLTYRVGIRKKLRKGEKLTPEEQDWVKQNPDKAYLSGRGPGKHEDDDFIIGK